MNEDSPKKYGKNLMRYKDPEARLQWQYDWKKKNPDKVRASTQRGNQKVKEETLSHYGKDGKVLCCWEGCMVDDPDLLTIDHIHNDGVLLRGRGQGKTGVDLYRKLRKAGWPAGYQTLCWNHQWKKEINLRREKGTKRDIIKVSSL